MLAVINVMINVGILVAPTYIFPHLDNGGLTGWVIMLLIADIWLGVGAKTGKRVLLVPWLIMYMIYIILTCIAAPFLLLGATTALQEAR